MNNKYILIILLISNILIANQTNSLAECKACHGLKFERPCFGVSSIVAKFNLISIKKALNGYKNKTYGGVMKEVMQNEVTEIKDINIVAQKVYDITHKSKNFILNKEIESCNNCHIKNKKKYGIKINIYKLSSSSLRTALIGYKNKKYGGKSKMIMNKIIDKYSYIEIEKIINKIQDKNAIQTKEQRRFIKKIEGIENCIRFSQNESDIKSCNNIYYFK